MQAAKLLTALALVAGSAVGSAQDVGDARKGLGFAQKFCSECHAILAREKPSPVPSAPPFQAVADTPGMTATALIVWFRTSHPTMPNLIIRDEDMDNVIAYILSLREKK